MFEKLIESLLQQILGEYIDGLDQQSLKVGLWSGDAKIENLRLKSDALLKLDLPFIVLFSRLGTLHLNIPWKNLATAPLQANLDTLQLIIQPQAKSDWKFGETTALEKLAVLDAFKQKLIAKLNAATNGEQSDGMMQRIIIRVMENLQISISNIHLRVDDVSSSCGFILEKLVLQTVNEQGLAQFTDRSSKKNQCLIKNLQIVNIGFYWQWKGAQKLSENEMRNFIPPQNDFIFRLSLASKVIQPPLPNNENLPDFTFNIDLQLLDIALAKPQLQQVLNLIEYLNSYNSALAQYQRQIQKAQPLSLNQKQIVRNIIQEIPFDKKYQDALKNEQLAQITDILNQCQVDDLKPIIVEIVKEKSYDDMKQKAIKKKSGGILRNWFGKKQETENISQEEQDEIVNFLKQNFEIQSENQKVTTLLIQGKMQTGSIAITNPRSKSNDELKIQFQELTCTVNADKEFGVQFQLNDMIVKFNNQEFLINSSNQVNQAFFDFKLQQSPTLTAIELITRSSKLRFHKEIIPMLSDFSNLEVQSDQLKNMADDRIQELKQNAQVALAKQVVVEHQRIIKVSFNQLYFELPISKQEQFVFCPGQVIISSDSSEIQESHKLELKDISLTLVGEQTSQIVNNFTISVEATQKQQQLQVNATIDKIICNLSPQNYQKLTSITDCFELENQSQIKPPQPPGETKIKLTEQASKIGPLFIREGQLNQWTKYNCLLSGSYLYFYSNPKAPEPTHIKWVKNAKVIDKGIDNFNMNVLSIEYENSSVEIGVQNVKHVQDWIDKIGELVDQEQILLKKLDESNIKQEKINTLQTIVCFSITQVQLNLLDSKNNQFLSGSTNNLSLKMEMKDKSMELQLGLQGLYISDNLRQYIDPELKYLVKSDGNDNLIQIQLKKIERTSKDYQDIDSEIKLRFGQIQLNYKAETFAYLMQFLSVAEQQNIQNNKIEYEQVFIEAEKQFLLMKLEVEIQQITVQVIHDIVKLPFAEVCFENGRINMLKYTDTMHLDVCLGNLQINDLTNYPYTLIREEDYKMIKKQQIVGLNSKNNSLLSVKIEMIEQLSQKAKQDRTLLKIQADISQIVADYQQQPVLRIIDQLNIMKEPFLNATSFKVPGFQIDTKSIKAAPGQILELPNKEDAQKLLDSPELMSINVNIDNPQIFIRNRFQLKECIIINLGRIQVSNEKIIINKFYKEVYTISISQMSIQNSSIDSITNIASDFDLKLTAQIPDLIPQYKALDQKPDETMYLEAEISTVVFKINRNLMVLVNKLVAYNFGLNDSFDEYILFNMQKSSQISAEESKILLKQNIEKRVRSSDYFMKFHLKIINVSIFLCIDRPLLRMSISDTDINFNQKKDDKKELSVIISSFDACVYEQINGSFISKPLIGQQKEISYQNLNDMTKLIYCQGQSSKGKIEMFINPTNQKTHNKLFLYFEELILTVQTKIIFQVMTIFEQEELEPYVNKQLQQYQADLQKMIVQQSEPEQQPTDSQIFIQLGNITIAIPSTDDSMLIITGKFNIILNTYDTLNYKEFIQQIKDQGLNQQDLKNLNFKMKSTIQIEQVQAFVASKKIFYTQDCKEKRQLIWPFSLLVNQGQQLVIAEDGDYLTEKQEFRISLSDFQFRMAFQDILFIQQQLESQLEIISSISGDAKQQQISQLKQTNEQSKLRISIDLVIDGISIVILNDLDDYYQYILQVQLFQFDSQFKMDPYCIKLNSKIPFQIQYFNKKIGYWESVIEKIDIGINYKKSLNNNNEDTQIGIQIQQNINLNLSTEAIITVNDAIGLLINSLKQQKKQSVSCVQQSYAKYAIYNQFGNDILCITQDEQYIIVKHLEYKPFDVQEQKTYIQLQIQGDRKLIEIQNWNIDKLYSKKDQIDNVPLIVKNLVEITKNQRVIYISSELMFQNDTQTQLELVFRVGEEYVHKLQNSLNQNKQSIQLQQHQFVLPQNYFKGEFCIRKLQDKTQTSKFYKVNQLRECIQKSDTLMLWLSKTFIIVINVCEDPNFQNRYIAHIQPNFRLQNLLPFPVSITTLYESTIGETQNLLPYQCIDEHQLQNSRDTHAIKIEIESYRNSIPIILLNNKNFRQETQTLQIQGEQWQGSQGGKSELILEYDYKEYRSSRLCSAILYAQEYLINETQYEFIAFQGKDGRWETIGGQKKGSKCRPLLLNDTQKYCELVFSDRATPQVLSLTPSYINSIGTSVSDIIFKKSELFYITPLAVTSQIKLIGQSVQKIITVKNRIIIANNCEYSACVKQQFSIKEIKPQERIPFEICYGDQIPSQVDKLYQFNLTLLEGYNWNWSGLIECNQVGVFYLQLRSQKFPGMRKFLQVDINETNGILFVVISETKHDQTPYKITNFSQTITLTVLNIPAELDFTQECQFAWDEPIRKNLAQIQIRPKLPNYENLEYDLNIDKIADAKFFKSASKNHQESIWIKLLIDMEGFTRHAKFYDSNEEEVTNYKQNKNLTKEQHCFKFDFSIEQLNINLIDNTNQYPIEILNLVLYQAEAIMLNNKSNKAVFQFKLQGLQIDNTTQLYPQFPVMLALLPKSKQQTLPILNILVQMNLQAKQVQLIDMFSIEMNSLAIKINEAIIKNILQTINKVQQLLEYKQQQKALLKTDWRKCPLPDKLIPIYIGQLNIYPIILELTVQWGKKEKNKDSDDIVSSLLSGVGFQLVSVDEAEISLKGIKLDDIFDTPSGLSNRIIQIYGPNIYQQLPAILGSLSVIGNPTKLLKNFVSGVQDLVERPLEGFTKGPLEGGMGVISGAQSLVSHTVSGVFNSVKNVVGTLSSGLTKVTMDEKYQQQRQIQNQQQAKNIQSGIAEGTVSLAKGVAGGLYGFFSKPVQGIKQDGASGFLKGVWQGTSGLVIKPVTGVLDVITKTSEGVKNQFSQDIQPNNKRIRYMRPFYQSDGYYKEYNWTDAECYEVIKGIKKGTYADHRLIKVIIIQKENHKCALIITDLSLILFDLDEHLKLWCLLHNDYDISCSEQVVQLKTKKSKKAFSGNTITYLNMENKQQSSQLEGEIKLIKQQQ